MKTSIALLPTLGFAVLLVSGCGTHGDLCNRAQECSGGSDQDFVPIESESTDAL